MHPTKDPTESSELRKEIARTRMRLRMLKSIERTMTKYLVTEREAEQRWQQQQEVTT